MERLSKAHFKQKMINCLNEGPSSKQSMLDLIEQYSKTKQDDIDELIDSLEGTIYDDECHFDHNKNCQAHMTFNYDGSCENTIRRNLVEKHKKPKLA